MLATAGAIAFTSVTAATGSARRFAPLPSVAPFATARAASASAYRYRYDFRASIEERGTGHFSTPLTESGLRGDAVIVASERTHVSGTGVDDGVLLGHGRVVVLPLDAINSPGFRVRTGKSATDTYDVKQWTIQENSTGSWKPYPAPDRAESNCPTHRPFDVHGFTPFVHGATREIFQVGAPDRCRFLLVDAAWKWRYTMAASATSASLRDLTTCGRNVSVGGDVRADVSPKSSADAQVTHIDTFHWRLSITRRCGRR